MLGNFIFGKKNLTATVGLYTENATRYTKKHVGFYNTYMCFPAFYVKHAMLIWLRQKHVPYTKQAYFRNKKTLPHSLAKAFFMLLFNYFVPNKRSPASPRPGRM